MGKIEFFSSLSGQGRWVEIASRGVIGNGDIGFAHRDRPSTGLNQQKKYGGTALWRSLSLNWHHAQAKADHRQSRQILHGGVLLKSGDNLQSCLQSTNRLPIANQYQGDLTAAKALLSQHSFDDL